MQIIYYVFIINIGCFLRLDFFFPSEPTVIEVESTSLESIVFVTDILLLLDEFLLELDELLDFFFPI